MALSKAPDGGWGWMIVLSAHIMHFLTGGLDRASGVFYREILRDLQQSSASTAGFTAILFGTRFLSAPLAGVLCKYFSIQRVMMVGGCIACSGVLLSSFMHNMALIYLTLGFMTGLGNGLAYTSGLLAVNDYFNRRKAAALGCATSGTGFGSFVMPLLTQWLINHYSYRGCMLILSGFSLNLVVCGALMYPLPDNNDNDDNNEADADGEQLKLAPDATAAATAAVNDADAPAAAAAESKQSGCSRFAQDLIAKFEFGIFLNPVFSIFALAALCISAGFKPVAVLLPDHANQSGLTETQSVLLISIAGVFDCLSRFSLGMIFDQQCLLPIRRHIWTCGMLVTAASITALAFMQSMPAFAALAAIFGLSSGLFVCQLYCILADLIGRESSRSGIGLLILCRGVGVVIGPPVGGALRDVTGNYSASFCALGAFVLMGFCCLCCLHFVLLCRGKLVVQEENNTNQQK